MENKTLFTLSLASLNAALSAVVVAVAGPKQREILTGVNVRKLDDDKISFYGCDSYRLNRAIITTTEKETINQEINFNFVLTVSSVEKIQNLAKTNKGAAVYASINQESEKILELQLKTVDDDILDRCYLETLPGYYPEIESLFKQRTNKNLIAFNPSFINDLRKAAKALNGSADAVTLESFNSPKSLLCFKIDNQFKNIDFSALVSPVKLQDQSGFDEMIERKSTMTDNTKQSIIDRLRQENESLKQQLKDTKNALELLNNQIQENARRDEMQPTATELTEKQEKEIQSLKQENSTLNNHLKQAIARVQELLNNQQETKQDDNNATTKENESLKIKIADLEKTIENLKAQQQETTTTTTATKPAALATEKQKKYIAALGGKIDDNATMKEASILIYHLKQERALKA